MALPERPLTILIAALGGEGGGVLSDWIIKAASARDYPVQSTSIPGVAQRTGATTYYLEIYPARTSELGGRRPVMTLSPSPSLVDVVVASELLEAGRAMQNGFVTPDRTTLIASTHRVYTVAEKMQMGDGRFDSETVLKAAQVLAKRAVTFDMEAQAKSAGTAVSAVMFGALAASGTLPLSRAGCEEAIRAGGKGAEASLKGFNLGYDTASGGRPTTLEETLQLRAAPRERVRPTFPPETHAILAEGVARCTDFQDHAYANLYLDRLEPIANLDHASEGFKLTVETGRFLALWMCYEDVIRVADLKTRKRRFDRIRDDVRAKAGEPMHVTEFLKPGIEEVAGLLPRFIARPLLWLARVSGVARKLNIGMQLRTTSVSGFMVLRSLAWLRPMRRRTSRWRHEQNLIGRWLASIVAAAKRDPSLALEIALCGRLIKGYGDTRHRGENNFLRILENLIESGTFPEESARRDAIRTAREAALADPDGLGLDRSLEAHGVAPRPARAHTIAFVRKPRGEARTAA